MLKQNCVHSQSNMNIDEHMSNWVFIMRQILLMQELQSVK